MFKNRHFTCGVQSTIPPEIISFIWCLIDDLLESAHDVDYLQIFSLWEDTDSTGESIQMVSHTQEKPQYKAVYSLFLSHPPINAKIFVIDDVSHSTMLLANEY